MKIFPQLNWLCVFLCLFSAQSLFSQNTVKQTEDVTVPYSDRLVLLTSSRSATHNANVKSNTYDGFFLYGSNMAWKNNNWKDQDVADLLIGSGNKNWEGVGANSLRPALYEDFIHKYGPAIRKSAFEYYASQGAKDNVVFIGDDPCDAHRAKKTYAVNSSGVAIKSESYETLYEPIWDNGENGTPVNDKNDYALYVYTLVKEYGASVKFWEIKNEPDYTPSPTCANNLRGTACNWWDKDPDPALLHNFHAPVQHYIRMLRVSYEVIKSVDPDAFICTGGIGYASFLDAILRNTDNPDGGKVTAEYPLKGGAWFDCLSYHYYPVYSLRTWSNGGFKYFRHSDAAVDALIGHKNKLEEVLKNYGYGTTYPEKEVIITETNIPNKQVQVYIGSEQAQRDYLIKTAILAQKNKIRGVYPYCPWDGKENNDNSGGEYDYSGFYKPIPESPGAGTLRMNESGIGWRTTSRLLKERKYDAAETAKLNIPSGVEGAAFYSSTSKDYVYAFWAKTTKDRDETASATYSFPAAKSVTKMVSVAWDEKETAINGSTVNLTGSPVFIKLNADITPKVPVGGVTLSQSSATLGKNRTLQLTATVTPADATNKNVSWTTSNPAVASVDNLGKVTTLTPGKSVITVTTVSGNKTATCDLTITSDTIALSYIQFPSYTSMNFGDTMQLSVTYVPSNATNKKINWISENPAIVSVDENGIATAHAVGKVKITASPVEGNGSKAKGGQINVNMAKVVESVLLSHTSKGLTVGDVLVLSAAISPSDATNKKVDWSSSNPAVASVDATGKVTALAKGTAIITVRTANGGKTATCNITVTEVVVQVSSVSLNMSSMELTAGNTLQLSATVNPTNATNKNVSWSSSNPAVASVDATGKVTALTKGTTVITVRMADGGATATCNITVKEEIHTGIDNITKSQFVISPNPTSGSFTIRFETSQEDMIQIELYSGAGLLVTKLLPKQTLESGSHSFGYNLSLQQGTYIVIIRGNNINEQQKLIVK